MKRLLPVWVVLGLFLAGGLIYGVTRSASNNYLSSHGSESAAKCSHTGSTHVVKIQNSKAVPAHVDAKRCDVLAIDNYDPVTREMAFGEHDHHTPYNGIYETTLKQNQGFKVTLNQAGNFRFHDHFDEAVAGTFTVLP